MTQFHFVVGGRGMIGSAVVHELVIRGMDVFWSTREREDLTHREHHLDLKNVPDMLGVGRPAVVYLVAATHGFAACEGNAESWRVNVDAQIALARMVRQYAFVVFVSSDAVEWASGTAYARQKAQVESYIQAIDGGIVRPARVLPSRAAEVARVIVDVGVNRKVGVTRWE